MGLNIALGDLDRKIKAPAISATSTMKTGGPVQGREDATASTGERYGSCREEQAAHQVRSKPTEPLAQMIDHSLVRPERLRIRCGQGAYWPPITAWPPPPCAAQHYRSGRPASERLLLKPASVVGFPRGDSNTAANSMKRAISSATAPVNRHGDQHRQTHLAPISVCGDRAGADGPRVTVPKGPAQVIFENAYLCGSRRSSPARSPSGRRWTSSDFHWLLPVRLYIGGCTAMYGKCSLA